MANHLRRINNSTTPQPQRLSTIKQQPSKTDIKELQGVVPIIQSSDLKDFNKQLNEYLQKSLQDGKITSNQLLTNSNQVKFINVGLVNNSTNNLQQKISQSMRYQNIINNIYQKIDKFKDSSSNQFNNFSPILFNQKIQANQSTFGTRNDDQILFIKNCIRRSGNFHINSNLIGKKFSPTKIVKISQALKKQSKSCLKAGATQEIQVNNINHQIYQLDKDKSTQPLNVNVGSDNVIKLPSISTNKTQSPIKSSLKNVLQKHKFQQEYQKSSLNNENSKSQKKQIKSQKSQQLIRIIKSITQPGISEQQNPSKNTNNHFISIDAASKQSHKNLTIALNKSLIQGTVNRQSKDISSYQIQTKDASHNQTSQHQSSAKKQDLSQNQNLNNTQTQFIKLRKYFFNKYEKFLDENQDHCQQINNTNQSNHKQNSQLTGKTINFRNDKEFIEPWSNNQENVESGLQYEQMANGSIIN